jgi:hypothetical protein
MGIDFFTLIQGTKFFISWKSFLELASNMWFFNGWNSFFRHQICLIFYLELGLSILKRFLQ